MNEEPQVPPAPRAVVSWALLLALAGVILGTACLMARNTIYTGGEVMEMFHPLMTGAVAAMLLFGFRSRNQAAWMVLGCGGALILWQANQTRRWAMLHEEVLSMVDHANRMKLANGSFPESIDGYASRHPRFRRHIHYGFHEGKLCIQYHLTRSGPAYWYHEDGGFHFHPG